MILKNEFTEGLRGKIMNEFDYYIFLDYSEKLIGYNIIEKANVKEILPKISKLKHYKNVKHKKEYLNSIKRILNNDELLHLFLKIKIKELRMNIEIYTDIAAFLKTHEKCIVFVSVDNNQYHCFCKFVNIIDGKNTKVIKESDLVIGSIEYKISLVIDNLLNLERTRKSK